MNVGQSKRQIELHLEGVLLLVVRLQRAHVAEESHIAFDTAPVELIFDASISHTMSAAEVSEYEALLMVEGDSDFASVDWQSGSQHNDVFQAESFTLVESSPWLLDSCASVGITHCRVYFSKLLPLKHPCVVHGLRGSTIMATGVGSITIPTGKGTKLKLDPVLFIAQLDVRLISIPNLDCAGYSTTFVNQHAKIHHPSTSQLVATGSLLPSCNIYRLNHLHTHDVFLLLKA